MRLLLPFQLLAPCRRERTLAGGRAPGGAGADRGGGVRMNRAAAVWLALLAIPARQLAPQQRDTVPDSVFLRVASTRWPEPREAFGEWRAFQSGRLHAQAPRCRNVAPALTRDSVGPVRPGMTLSELLRVCPHTLRLWSYYAPRDRWSPVVAVALGSAILTSYLEDTLPLSKIGSLALSDTGIRGPGGLGAGSTYGEFKARYGQGTLNGGAEECTTVEVTFPALPGEFFDLDYRSQCEDPPETAVLDARVVRIYLEPPTPAEVAARASAGRAVVSDSAFFAATSVTWPRPSVAYVAAKIPWEATAIPRCASQTPVITGDSLGPLVIGETLDQLRQRCPRMLYVWILERKGEPVVALRVGESRIVARMYDTLPASKVRLIEISDSTPRTADGFGVGSKAADLLVAHRDFAMISGGKECVFFFQRSLRGLTFVVPPEACTQHREPGARVKAEDLFLPDTKITTIWIKGSH